MSTRIIQAIETTLRVIPGYLEKTCEQRLPGGCGSVLLGNFETVEDVIAALKAAEWLPYPPEGLLPGCWAFSTRDLRGRMGVVRLDSLPANAEVVLDDRKGTGKVSATVVGDLGEEVDFTVLILGPEQGEEVVYTFHPGAPVKASQVQCDPGMHGRKITVQEALNMGLETAKIVAA